ncbi:MAG: PIN domain-containing protein [Candidatus Bathyarchaeia archaeon]
MSKTVYDTRFFIEHYYSKNKETLRRIKEEIRKTKEKYISPIVIHEVYQLTLKREGRETAILRTNLLEKDFKIININTTVAKTSAELRHKYKIPMADSMIAATSLLINAVCFTDDPHLTAIKEIRAKWI